MKSTYDLIGTFWDGRRKRQIAQTVPYDLMPEAGTPYCLFDINGKRRGIWLSVLFSPFGMRRTGAESGRPWPAAVKSR